MQMVARAVAINVERFGDYLTGKQPVSQYRSTFTALAAT